VDLGKTYPDVLPEACILGYFTFCDACKHWLVDQHDYYSSDDMMKTPLSYRFVSIIV